MSFFNPGYSPLAALAASDGATKVGRGASTVDADLTAVEAAASAAAAAAASKATKEDVSNETAKRKSLLSIGMRKPVNGGFNGIGAVNVLGDSISHGAFAGNLFQNGWTRLLGRMINAEFGGRSYGFTPYLTLGSGPTTSTDVHAVGFTGSWGASPNSGKAVSGLFLRETTLGAKITFTVPFFQNAVRIWWAQLSGGCTFTIKVNGSLVDIVNTAGVDDWFKNAEYALSDNGYGETVIELEITVTGIFDFGGITYTSGSPQVTLNNLSQSGRKLADADVATLQFVCENSATLLMCLGHNDTAGAALTSAIDTLITHCNANNVKLFVCDFRWTSAPSDDVRQELKRLADNVDGATYIPFPDFIKPDGSTPDSTYLVTTLGMWADGSHPNEYGNQWIAETIAQYMGLSVSSKRDALESFDYWFPLKLESSVSVENSLPSGIGTVSSFKRQGNTLHVKGYVQMAPGGSFPVGSYTIQTAWPTKSAFASVGAAQGITKVGTIRNDTGAVVSNINCSGSGTLTIDVLDGTWINDLVFDFTMPVVI